MDRTPDNQRHGSHPPPWRVGTQVGRTIYDSHDRLIGVMDTVDDARFVVDMVNHHAGQATRYLYTTPDELARRWWDQWRHQGISIPGRPPWEDVPANIRATMVQMARHILDTIARREERR